MPPTYTSNNRIKKIANGDETGTWGTTTNTNFDLFDTAIDGSISVSLTGTTGTLNIPDGAAGDGRNKVLIFTGTPSGTNTVSVTPNTAKKHYFVQNNTNQSVIISQGSGSTVTVKAGYSSIVYLDGAGSGAAVKEVLTALKLTGVIESTGAVLNGATSGSTTLSPTAIASGTLTLPAATDTLVGRATTDTLTNKTINGSSNTLSNIANASLVNSQVTVNGTTISLGGSGTITAAVANALTIGTGLTGTSYNGSAPVTIAIDSTVLTASNTQTLTNKTFDTAGTGNVFRINGTQVSAVTGTGSAVLASSPTLTTPDIGTPSAGTLTNCTGLPISTGVSGLGSGVGAFLATPTSANLAAAVTDETGSGALVFGTSPTLASPAITGTLTAGGGVGTSGQVLQSTGSGIQWASVSGSSLMSVTSKTANYTVSTGDGDDVLVRTDCTSGAVTITLYTAVGNTGKMVSVKKIDSSANAVTIATTSSQTIDGSTTRTISSQYNSLTMVSNGTNWDII